MTSPRHDGPPRDLPPEVRIAALLFVLYGAAVVVNAALAHAEPGGLDARGMIRTMVRCGGTWLVAWALLRRERWAWTASVVISLLWILAAALAWIALASLNGSGRVWWSGSRADVFLLVALLLLSGALGLLLTRPARDAFRGR